MFGPTRVKILPLSERWQSGRLYLTRNQAYCKVPRVRIPPSPPDAKKALISQGFFLFEQFLVWHWSRP